MRLFFPPWFGYLWFEVSGFANIASFKMAANIEISEEEMSEISSSDHSSPSEDDPIREAKQFGANLCEPKKAAIVRKRKIQTNTADRKRCTRGDKDLNVNAW